MKPKISILLPAYKSGKLLNKVFLQSYLKNTKEDCELIIYNNDAEGNFEFLLNFDLLANREDIVLISNGMENIGLNPALNECAETAEGEWLYLCHTDMFLMPGWDTALLNAAKNNLPSSLLLCSRSIERDSHIPMQLLRDFGTDIESFKEKELYEFFKSYNDKNIVTGYRMPFMLHRSLYEKMKKFNIENGFGEGGFDSSFFSYATDNDLFFTAHKVGVRKFWMCNESAVYHLSGHSNKQQKVDKDSIKPYEILVSKWKKFGYDINMNIDASEQKLAPWGTRVK